MASSPSLIGQTIGPYDIHALIAEGGMAQVYLATHRFLNRQIALKVLFPAHAADAEFVERLRREGEHTAHLQHPHIVQVFDAGVVEDRFYLAMAYIQGQSLLQRLQLGALTLNEAALILSQIASALDYAHAQGVTHRDVKPSNILLDCAGRAFLTDFGIAKARMDPALTLTGVLIGTPAYMAPELITGHPFDGRADIYALGLVLYEMVAGRPAFHGGLETILYQQVHQAPTPPQHLNLQLPAKAGGVILRALDKDPARRFASAGAFSRAFQEAIAASASGGKVSFSCPAAAPTSVTRSPSLLGAIVGGVALVVLMVSLSFALLRPRVPAPASLILPSFTATTAWIITPTSEVIVPMSVPLIKTDAPTALPVTVTPVPEPTATATLEATPTPKPPTSTPVPVPTVTAFQHCILPSANPNALNAPANNINPQTCLGEGLSIPVGMDIEVLPNEVSWQAPCGEPVIRAIYQETGYLLFPYRIGIRTADGACTSFDWQSYFSQERTE